MNGSGSTILKTNFRNLDFDGFMLFKIPFESENLIFSGCFLYLNIKCILNIHYFLIKDFYLIAYLLSFTMYTECA